MAIELTAAKCPCCGADLMLNEQMESGFCQYCGSKILVKAAIAFNKVIVEGTVQTKNADFIVRAGTLESYNGESIEVTIPDNVVIIGDSVFKGCAALRSVTIPESVTGIGNLAFEGCTNLTSVVIPKSVTGIGNSAFEGCTNLTSVVIPENVTEIGHSAFRGCTNLTSVVIPKGITRIYSMTFYYCTNLTNVVIPESVIKIDDGAFGGCTNLAKVTISGETFVSERAFYKSTFLIRRCPYCGESVNRGWCTKCGKRYY